jgi:hypothetical protein
VTRNQLRAARGLPPATDQDRADERLQTLARLTGPTEQRVWISPNAWVRGRAGRYHAGPVCKPLPVRDGYRPAHEVGIRFARMRHLKPCAFCFTRMGGVR